MPTLDVITVVVKTLKCALIAAKQIVDICVMERTRDYFLYNNFLILSNERNSKEM